MCARVRSKPEKVHQRMTLRYRLLQPFRTQSLHVWWTQRWRGPHRCDTYCVHTSQWILWMTMPGCSVQYLFLSHVTKRAPSRVHDVLSLLFNFAPEKTTTITTRTTTTTTTQPQPHDPQPPCPAYLVVARREVVFAWHRRIWFHISGPAQISVIKDSSYLQ